MELGLEGKRVVVAGGSRGIGRSIALAFAGEGADVSICARSEGALRETEAELKRCGGRVHAATCDLGDGAAVRGYVEAAAAALGGIDILVNNASGFGRTDDEAGWAASINVDLMGSVRASHAAIPHMDKAGGGCILHISSISGLGANVRTPPYGAVKAALIQYTLTQAAALAKQNIRVNCIAPGSIEFPGGVWDQAKTGNPKLYNAILGGIPFGRMGRPEEVANLALFLCSNAASWVTGQTVAADGGQNL
ncbi:SDR family NAD(P)-dependent oxidoreductase [Ferrovibrio sp.]|uniref:SDR family NAD(P)-dependent oxidoreductase n=1 Tax=Ferrovibrio sp. TaxID=1917215 RepID=UPI00261B901B|nr:SDR family NAD(P)-dependent oxidoreductase [Ferrovibrio sp.]